jgi:hypothetical protein
MSNQKPKTEKGQSLANLETQKALAKDEKTKKLIQLCIDRIKMREKSNKSSK